MALSTELTTGLLNVIDEMLRQENYQAARDALVEFQSVINPRELNNPELYRLDSLLRRLAPNTATEQHDTNTQTAELLLECKNCRKKISHWTLPWMGVPTAHRIMDAYYGHRCE